MWTAWLALAAVLPDIDYPLLWIFGIHAMIRYTHSIAFAAMVGLTTLLAIRIAGVAGLRIKAFQVFMAAFSHLVLDSLVGVHPNPWFWPLSANTFRLPFGVLPSAGKLDFSNGHLYFNAFLEFCILSPMIWIPWILDRKKGVFGLCCMAAAIMIWIPFPIRGFNLNR